MIGLSRLPDRILAFLAHTRDEVLFSTQVIAEQGGALVARHALPLVDGLLPVLARDTRE